MNKCSIVLSLLDGEVLKGQLLVSKFNRQLMRYYLGKGSSPDISDLKRFLLDELIPSYFSDFKPSDLVDFLSHEINTNRLNIALLHSFTASRTKDTDFLKATPVELKNTVTLIEQLLGEAELELKLRRFIKKLYKEDPNLFHNKRL